MPEFKHHFRRGRMNKDLDERLLPNGEYRDAQNVEIVTSEGSDVGSIQNVLGTVLGRGRLYDESTQVLTEWSADSNFFDLINPTCIGSFVDTQNDNIYWFIHYSFLNDSKIVINGSAIIEYDDTTKVIQPILVDINNILKFSSNYLITGINVIDGLFFWTDNQTEPKRINISKFKEGTVVGSDQFKVQTKYLGATGSDFTEKDITVIKLSPNIKPKLNLSASKRTGVGTGNQPITVQSHSESFRTAEGDAGVSRPNGYDLFLVFPLAPNYKDRDILKLSYTDSNALEGDVSYEILVQVTKGENSFKKTFVKIQSIPDEVPYGTNLPWEVVLLEDEPLFEDKFVRFSYRWKYIDGEYSTFAPFSNIAFLPSDFEYKSSDGYNTGMINTARQIEIQSLETPPVGVVEVDLLYKESNNNNVYVVDRIKTEDLSTEFPYEIKSEIVGDVVESNQMLRPWDNVPLRAKSQEISSNRVLYGNYTQGYDIENNRLPDIKTTHNSIDITTVGTPEKSIKSQRTYQVGVVYLDPYSRETPVFSKKEAAVTISKEYADKVNSLSCELNNNAPNFATHFKHFVKETSSEYYNIALDRYYLAEDGNIWLSFPSSERNKVSEEDYLILKKKHDKSVFVSVDNESPNPNAKYKILDIKNEVPEFIATELKSKALATVKCRVDNNILLNEPLAKAISFQFLGPTDVQNPSFYNSFSSDAKIVITTIEAGNDIGSTKRYKLSKGGPTGKQESSLEIYEVTLTESIRDIDKNVFATYKNDDTIDTSYLIDGSNNAIDFKIEVLEKESINKAQFFGRFFAKINRDVVFDENIIETFPAATTEYASVRNVSVISNATSDPDDDKKDSDVDWCWTDTNPSNPYDKNYANHPELGSNKFTVYLAGVDLPGDKSDKNNKFEDVVTQPVSKDLRTTGTLIQFENANGNKGSVYKIKNSEVATGWRSKKDSRRKRTSGRRREFTITIEKVTNDITNKNKNYDDGFDYDVTDTTSEKGRISKINIMRRLVSTDFLEENDISSDNPAIFEVEPKESIDLDIYNEVGSALPIVKTGLKVTGTNIAANTKVDTYKLESDVIILDTNTTGSISAGTVLTLTDPKGIYSFKIKTSGTVSSGTKVITIAESQVHGQHHQLDFSNCYSFGQGVESNRLRDDYNAITIDKGPVVSTIINEKYKQDVKLNTIIWSGIFNSTGGVNKLNEFIQAEKITKDLNPEYGSIQKLHVRDTDLIALCEDKVLRILANKDALFNADGNTNLTSTNNVLGQAMPFVGEHGISKNPESFVSHAYRVYFSDKARGSVLRLSRDGLTDIATKGMTDWFNDNLPLSNSIVGSYNQKKGSYNLTLNNYTLCFDERVDGWTSFKSFIPESGVSLNNVYYTFKNGYLYSHNNKRRNSFHQTLAKVISTNSGNNKIVNISSQPSVENINIGDYLLSSEVDSDITVTSIVIPYVSTGTVNGATSTSVNVAVDGNSGTISVNDIVTGTGIASNITVKVASVTDQNNIVLDTALSLSNETVLSFTGTSPNKTLDTVVTFSSAPALSNSSNIEFTKTYDSSVTLLINDEPSTIKEYKTLSYEGTDSKAYTYSGTISVDAAGNSLSSNITIAAGTPLSDLQKYKYNANQIAQLTESVVTGWSSTSITTDSQSGSVKLFKNKEGLWSNSISGDATSASNIDTRELSVQGLGAFSTITGATSPTQAELTISLANSTPNHNTDISATKTINGLANGANINSTYGTLDLIIYATIGYSLDASNFAFSSASGVSGAGVSGISFTQHGINVKATITFSGVMPSSDDAMLITITGEAIANTYTVDGTYDTIEDNTTTGSSDSIAYSGSGVYDKKTVANASTDPVTYTSVPEDVFIKTFTANANHFFYTRPVVFIEEEDSSSVSAYTITCPWAITTATVNGAVNGTSVTLDAGHSGIAIGMAVTGVGLGQNCRVSSISSNTLVLTSSKIIPDGATLTFTPTSVTFTVKYVYGINNPKFDKLVFTAKAIEVFDPGISELTSFVSGNKTILSGGESRTMVIQGSTGYDDETNATFTFSNEASGTAVTFTATSDNTTATATFSDYVGTVRPGMSVSGTNVPAGTVVSYVVVNPTTNSTTVHVTLANAVTSTPSGVITFAEYYNSSNSSWQSTPYIITLPEIGRLSITKVYNPTTSTSYYRYFIRAIDALVGTHTNLSSSFSGNAVLDSSNDFALCEVNQYEKPTININATSNIVDSASAAINIRNLDSTVTVGTATAKVNVVGGTSASTAVVVDNNIGTIQAGFFVTGTGIVGTVTVESLSDQQNLVLSSNQTIADNVDLTFSGAAANSKTIILASGNTEIKIGMLVTGTNILAKTRVKSISGTTLTIDQTPTLAPSDELKFLDNGRYEAYGEPNSGSIYSKIPFKVVASVGGSTELSKQRDISIEDDFQYSETTLFASSVSSTVVGFSSTVPQSIVVGSIITSNSITSSYSNNVITVAAITSTTQITLALDGITLNGTNSHGTSTASSVSTYVTVNDELTFSAPYSWDISLSNLSEAITGSNKIYTLTGLMSVARYGNQNLPIGLNLDNILARTSTSGGSGGSTTNYIFIEKIFSTSYYISSLVMYPKSVAVGTTAGTVITFTGSVLGNWYGNAMSGIKMYLGSATGFNDASGGSLTFGEAGDVQASIISTLTFANSSPTTTGGTFSFDLQLAATAAAGQTLTIEPRIYLPIQP